MSDSVIVQVNVANKIVFVRGQKVIVDFHLAELYVVETKARKRAIKRNQDRFPEDFCFELSAEEFDNLRYHFGTSRWGEHTKYLPIAFTEQGVAMLSSVLRSKRAALLNIEIMRAFVQLCALLATNKELTLKLEELEKKYDKQSAIVIDAIRKLMQPPDPPKRQIDFYVDEPKARYRLKRKR